MSSLSINTSNAQNMSNLSTEQQQQLQQQVEQQRQQMMSNSSLCTPHLSMLKLDTDPARLAMHSSSADGMSPNMIYSSSFGSQMPLTPPGSTLFSSPYSINNGPLSASLEGPSGGFSYMDQLTQGLSLPSASSLIRGGDESPHPLMARTPQLLSLPHMQNWMVESPLMATTPISPLENESLRHFQSMGASSEADSISGSSTVAPIPIKGKMAKAGGKIPSRLSTVTPPRTPSVPSPRKRSANTIEAAGGACTSGPMSAEARKAVHKLSEQRRREQLKSCFDQLLSLIPVDTQANPLASLERQPNRVEILRRTLEYLHALRNQNSSLISRVQELESQMGISSSLLTSAMPITVSTMSATAVALAHAQAQAVTSQQPQSAPTPQPQQSSPQQ